ncbi:MAG: hypothetical protein P8X73_14445, partial [Ignavibacteriaceae bacterium]
KIKASLSELDHVYKAANKKLIDVQRKGMNDVDIGFILKDAHQKLIEARTLVHTFNADTSISISKEGIKLINQADLLSDKEIDKYYNRRYGFLIATFILIIFAVAIYLRIRDIENKQSLKKEVV